MRYIDKLRYEWGNSTDGSEWVEFLERRLESLFQASRCTGCRSWSGSNRHTTMLRI